MPVPHPTDGPLYVKLRDNPAAINSTTLQAQLLPPSVDDPGRASARHSALPGDKAPAPPSDKADPSPERNHANP